MNGTAAEMYGFTLLVCLAAAIEITRLQQQIADLQDALDGAREAVEMEQASHQATRLHHGSQPRAIRATTNHELPKEGQ
ncbi:hypothetical protein [Streptomyces sp. 891-h]|uniref:hypothetical protein n=1 Tax=Streptomyces sp. 891-h TaxID=2720714 RepID=UPI001FA9BCED|nr:hypothetical protein [Streptomyces sp. 891-h]UNZ20579.1 hypothetical protein HC362_29480 [Streptomyces sp. 891-h]